MASTRAHHYLTQSWKHILPHAKSLYNLDRIARLVTDYDIVALQEADAGSLRSQFVNQVEYLAERSHFPFWYHQTTRNLGRFAQHSNGLLSRFRPNEITEYRLPGLIPGRGALLARYGHGKQSLCFLLVHLALGKRSRRKQLDFLCDLINEHGQICLMGDFNCSLDSPEMSMLFNKTQLNAPAEQHLTFPSWRPARNIDHILTTPSVEISSIKVLSHSFSDHLPIAMEIKMPPY